MSRNPSYDFGYAALCLGHMSATSTRLKLNGVTLGPRLKAQLLQPFVSRDYPLHYVHAESKIVVKSRHFEVTCDILRLSVTAAECGIPTHSGTSKTQLGNLHQFIPWIVASRTDAGQIPNGTFHFAVFDLKGIKGEPPSARTPTVSSLGGLFGLYSAVNVF